LALFYLAFSALPKDSMTKVYFISIKKYYRPNTLHQGVTSPHNARTKIASNQ